MHLEAMPNHTLRISNSGNCDYSDIEAEKDRKKEISKNSYADRTRAHKAWKSQFQVQIRARESRGFAFYDLINRSESDVLVAFIVQVLVIVWNVIPNSPCSLMRPQRSDETSNLP
jgi:hypothetical protein